MNYNDILGRLQKVDEETLEIIDLVRDQLFKLGIRTSRERAWEVFKQLNKIPFEYLIDRNKEIEYQGQGTHITNKFANQRLVIKDVGRYEIKAVGRKDAPKKAVIKFIPSEDIKKLAAGIEVKE